MKSPSRNVKALAVIPSEARNLALNGFKPVRDSSSPEAPPNDTQNRVLTQTPLGSGFYARLLPLVLGLAGLSLVNGSCGLDELGADTCSENDLSFRAKRGISLRPFEGSS